MRIIAALICADNADILVVLTNSYAAAAENALGVVADKMNAGCIEIRLKIRLAELILVNAVFAAESLKLTVSAARTGQTVHSVV